MFVMSVTTCYTHNTVTFFGRYMAEEQSALYPEKYGKIQCSL
jgi:hypothetical protein